MPKDKMELENQILRVIYRHCDRHKILMDSEATWELAKKIGSICKLKIKNDDESFNK